LWFCTGCSVSRVQNGIRKLSGSRTGILWAPEHKNILWKILHNIIVYFNPKKGYHSTLTRFLIPAGCIPASARLIALVTDLTALMVRFLNISDRFHYRSTQNACVYAEGTDERQVAFSFYRSPDLSNAATIHPQNFFGGTRTCKH